MTDRAKLLEALRECREIVDRQHEILARWLRNGAGVDADFQRTGALIKRLEALLSAPEEAAQSSQEGDLTVEQIEEWREMLLDPTPWASEEQRVKAINMLCNAARAARGK